MSRPRLLLLLPSTTYRADAYVSAALRLDADLTIASDHVSTMAGAQPDRLLALDLARADRAAAGAQAFAAVHTVAAVAGVDDDTALVAAHVARALGLPHDAPEACLAARDKHLQRRLLTEAGVRVPAFTLHRFDDDLPALARAARYPCVLKPTRLSMSRGVIRADDAGAFVAAAERIRRILEEPEARRACGEDAGLFLCERFVPGREVALEGVMVGGRLRVLALFDKPDPLDGPFFEETIYATPSGMDPAAQEAIAALVERAARALGLRRSPVHAEVRWNEAGPWLIELAARPIGGRCGAVLRFGPRRRSLEDLLLAHALGFAIPAEDWTREDEAAAVMMVPTPRAGVLREVRGVGAAKLVPWVDDVQITAHRGQRLVPLPEGSRYLGFIFARAADAATAVAALRAAHAALDVALD